MQATIDKRAVARAFGRAASAYDQHAALQRAAGEKLMSLVTVPPAQRVLDAGCGTGWFSQRWQQQGHEVIALDLSPGMLAQAAGQQAASSYLAGDIEQLPLADRCVDLTWSNLAVQWCSDLRRALDECRRVTRVGGKVLFSTLTADSLSEVHHAWQAVDAAPHANRFLTQAQIVALCTGLPLHWQHETLTLAFPGVLEAMRSLKGIGATHLPQGRTHTLLTRSRLQQLEAAWPQDARGYLLTYHLFYGVIDGD
ncbi:malonyl-ACP O-methyltransferase BioC [Duffyella gerundensis]|uniref:malonyl-ACP O-methyltransferase BioC n=1 Tax=Duffyella gerundensis TaxID=1619313 RepID=UPI0016545F94|nr:malonyl-ACP O-methyltransferase BioC [Duffyella gerundensis]